jgi:flagellar FliL protein
VSAPEVHEDAPPKKSKKMLVIIAAALVVVVGAAAAFFIISRKHAAEEEDGEDEKPAAVVEHKGPPAYLPMDNMVINLADPGGERVAQIGVTLELDDEHAIEHVKAFLPSIRGEVLLLISQRTADELLTREGKDKLIEDIIAAAGKHFDGGESEKKKKKDKKDKEGGNPVHGVVFSSFIIQ